MKRILLLALFVFSGLSAGEAVRLLSVRNEFLLQQTQGSVHEGERPLAIEVGVRNTRPAVLDFHPVEIRAAFVRSRDRRRIQRL